MNFCVFKNEFKRSYKGVLIWSVVVGACMALIIGMYPLVKNMYAVMLPILQGSVPGMDVSAFEAMIPSNIIEYFVLESGSSLIIISSIFAAIYGINYMSADYKSGNAEFLYSQGVNKNKIFLTKLLNLIVSILIFNAIVTIISLGIMIAVEQNFASLGNLFIYFGAITLLQIEIGVLCFSLSSVLKSKCNIGIALALAFGLYIISFVSQIADEVKFLKYFSPDGVLMGDIAKLGFAGINWWIVGIWAVITLGTFIASFIAFNKRDVLI